MLDWLCADAPGSPQLGTPAAAPRQIGAPNAGSEMVLTGEVIPDSKTLIEAATEHANLLHELMCAGGTGDDARTLPAPRPPPSAPHPLPAVSMSTGSQT